MGVSQLSAVLAMVAVLVSGAEKDKQGPDLAKIIECRANMKEYHDLGAKLGDDLTGTELGWKRLDRQPNPFLTEFQLPKSVQVFGHSTKRIALTGSGVLAIFDNVKAEALAAQLRLEPVVVAPGRSILARIVKQDADDVASTTIRLNVSTVESHPGKVLAGCEYQVDVK
jgi:hypothetical protein